MPNVRDAFLPTYLGLSLLDVSLMIRLVAALVGLVAPLGLAFFVGYYVGSRGKASALAAQQERLLPVVATLRNMIDADPLDASEWRLRRTEAELVLDSWTNAERKELTR